MHCFQLSIYCYDYLKNCCLMTYWNKMNCYVKNYYTGTQMNICGGYIDIAADKFTYNLQLKAGDKVYTMTGSHPAELYYFRDYSSRAKNLKLYTVE